jgi:hypothetical protein
MFLFDRPRARRASPWLLLALGLAALPFSHASAAPVPAATYSITLNNSAPITTPGSFGASGEIGEIQNVPSPLVFAHVGGTGRSLVEMQYWFRVNGPALHLPVPIQIAGRVQLDAGGAQFQQNMIWGVSANLIAQALDGELGPGVGEVDNGFGGVSCNPNSVGPIPVPLPIPSCSATSQDQPVVLTLNTLSGADNRVTLLATANNQESFVASFDARVDPVISFAPGFDATGYSIELSGGVGNAVPEPSTALLVGTALGLLPRVRRRRRRSGGIPPRAEPA